MKIVDGKLYITKEELETLNNMDYVLSEGIEYKIIRINNDQIEITQNKLEELVLDRKSKRELTDYFNTTVYKLNKFLKKYYGSDALSDVILFLHKKNKN